MFGNIVAGVDIAGLEFHHYVLGQSAVGNAMCYSQQAHFLIDDDFFDVNNSFTRNCFSPQQLKIATAFVELEYGTWKEAVNFANTWPTDANGDFIYGTIDEGNQMIAIVDDLLAGEDVVIVNVPEGECPGIGSIGEILGTVSDYNVADLCVYSVCNTFYEGPTVCNPFFPIMESLGTTAQDYAELIPESLLDGEYGPVFTSNDRECVYRIDNSLCFDAEETITAPGYEDCGVYVAPAGYHTCYYSSVTTTIPFQDVLSLFTEDGEVYIGEIVFHNNNYFSANADKPLYTYGQLKFSGKGNPKSRTAELEEKSKKFEILRKNILKMCNFA